MFPINVPILLNIWNEGILEDCTYPDKLKSDVSPIYKHSVHPPFCWGEGEGEGGGLTGPQL